MATHLPELLVLTVDVDPEVLHEREGVAGALGGQEARDVGVVARRVAVLGESTITAIRWSHQHFNVVAEDRGLTCLAIDL